MALVMLVFWSSCNKYDQAPTTYDEKATSLEAANDRDNFGLQISNGMLKFNSQKDFNKALSQIRNSPEKLYSYGKEFIGFKSMLNFINEIMSNVENYD